MKNNKLRAIVALVMALLMLTSLSYAETVPTTDAPEKEAPEVIQKAVDLAIAEWEKHGGQRLPKSNEYTKWFCRGKPCSFGWCGGFVSYCLFNTLDDSVTTFNENKSEKITDDRTAYVWVAAPVKFVRDYGRMERLTKEPRVGYIVVYGQRSYYATVHVSLVTKVEDRGNGLYHLETVEGYLGGRIKRLSYLYDMNAEKADRNILPLPEAERTQPEVFSYEVTKDYYVNTFCATWK